MFWFIYFVFNRSHETQLVTSLITMISSIQNPFLTTIVSSDVRAKVKLFLGIKSNSVTETKVSHMRIEKSATVNHKNENKIDY